MKKMIIAASIVCAAAIVQAASVSWNSGVVFGPSDSSGTLVASAGYKLADTATATMYLFSIADATSYAKVQADGVWATYGEKLGDATASTSTLSSSKFSTLVTEGHAASSTAYAAIIITYKDGDGTDWYLENLAQTTISDLGANATLNNLARYNGGLSSNGQIASWSSVPAPTSGLLMLVGLAGLALRRRRA